MYAEEVEYEDEQFYDEEEEEDEEEERPPSVGDDVDDDDDDEDDSDDVDDDVWDEEEPNDDDTGNNRGGISATTTTNSRAHHHPHHATTANANSNNNGEEEDEATAAAAAAAAAGSNSAMDEDFMDGDDEMNNQQEMEGQLISEQDYEPSDQEILEYCEWLGMDTASERQLMWIAREALKAPLPENWKICYTEDREVYYFNVRTGESIWDHPMDAYYKALFKQEKAKLDKKKKHMRMFSGGLAIKPLADFFSEEADPMDAKGDDTPWATIPDSLTDAIDFKIFIDPVVLPTSGRTVSRHTIINNKWRDPFTREYVENRRLVPNVDKRNEVDAWLNIMLTCFIEALSPDVDGLKKLLRVLPFMIDKEDEVCVRGQKTLLSWLEKHFFVPAAQKKAAEAAAAAAQLQKQQQAMDSMKPTAGKSAQQQPQQGANSKIISARKSVDASSEQTTGSKGADGTAQKSINANKNSNVSGSNRKTSVANQQNKVGSMRKRRESAKPTGASASSGPTPPNSARSVLGSEVEASALSSPSAALALPSWPSLDDLIEHNTTTDERHTIISSLLTMSSSCSREMLLNVILHVKCLRAPTHIAGAFQNYDDEVMNVLHLTATDLMRTAAVIVQRVSDAEAAAASSPLNLSDITMMSAARTDSSVISASAMDGAGTPTSSAQQQQQQQQTPQRFASLPPLVSSSSNNNLTNSGSNSMMMLGAFHSSSNSGLFLVNSSSGAEEGTTTGQTANITSARFLGPSWNCYVIQNSDHITSLQWVHAIADIQRAKHDADEQEEEETANDESGSKRRISMHVSPILSKLDFVASMHLVVAMYITPAIATAPSVINAILRGVDGWPSKLNGSPDEHVQALTQLALDDPSPHGQIVQLHDVLFHGGERHVDMVKQRAPQIACNLRQLAREELSRPRTVAVDMFGALAVFNEIVKIDCFKDFPTVLLRIGSNLGPRMTRSQWKPKHFHETVSAVMSTASTNPVETWHAIGSKGVLFLTKELSKKKTNSEENRSKLETIEAIERQMQQSNAISNWDHLATKLLHAQKNNNRNKRRNSSKDRKQQQGAEQQEGKEGKEGEHDGAHGGESEGAAAPGPARGAGGCSVEESWILWNRSFDKMKLELQRQRAANYVSALNILLLMRLKPKQRPVNPPSSDQQHQHAAGAGTGGGGGGVAVGGGTDGKSGGRSKQSAPTTPMQDASRAPQRSVLERKPSSSSSSSTTSVVPTHINNGNNSVAAALFTQQQQQQQQQQSSQRQHQQRMQQQQQSTSGSSVTLPPI